MEQVLHLADKILTDMMSWYGKTFKGALIDLEGSTLIIVLKEVSGISFTSRGEISWFFMRRALKEVELNEGCHLEMIIFSDKEVKYGIPYLSYASKVGKVVYDPEGLFSSSAKIIDEGNMKILDIAEIKKGEVVEIEQQ
ncbi:hypothetical protein [Sulfuracidifex metallicus]|uniref:Uncharacterized protein n=1 Tax=Sulfuracidifex metallicus DSM 6482 = JCM 9184 TaxID=523847 RepID=A0A6A9QKS9_SULME|nr:hypothetical protein [Sulfuracidifex metallicus]MUN29224.1 hypothetical protein [Sulfuracidifex metallicus DSM 6482 = JCM 9184]WOE50257.1 hypothetical protein RQ359_001775 [Sulfuracidifex metallicus DSM 6482 = JCM 9184]